MATTTNEKRFSITVFEKNGDKDHSDLMTYHEAFKWVQKLRTKKAAFDVWEKEENSNYLNEATYKF